VSKPEPLPNLCDFHRPLYAAKAKRLRRSVHHPGAGRKALAEEARTVSRQCPSCP
jgi:hypothetical protein